MEKNSEQNLNEIIGLLQPFLRASLVLENVPNWNSLLDQTCANELQEIYSDKVTLVGVDFSESPIPNCKAEALFKVTLLKNPKGFDLEAWQDEHLSYLHDAVSFSWELPKTPATDGLDLTFGDNSGVECFIVDEETRTTEKGADFSEKGESPADCAWITIVGMSDLERGELFDFLKENWAEDVANMAEIESNLTGDWKLAVRGGLTCRSFKRDKT